MLDLTLTDQEKAAFYQDITRNWTLDYFYVFDNVPLGFVYQDDVIPGELTELEERNKLITETLWMKCHHQLLPGNAAYSFTYRGGLQEPFQVHLGGAGYLTPPEQDDGRAFVSAEEVQAKLDSWMASTGRKLTDELRKQAPIASWRSLLAVPDRTIRLASVMPVGNQVVTELICTWTEDGALRETAWVAVLVYDVDGIALLDRSYVDGADWPSANKARAMEASRPPQDRAEAKAAEVAPTIVGAMEQFFDCHRALQIKTDPSDLEKRNLAIVEGAWVDAQNGDLDMKAFHPDRFRMQLPMQKCSYNLDIAKDVAAVVRQAAPDMKMTLGMTYAKGNRVVAEGVVSWSRDGRATETPFISFLLLDEDGSIIRERRYQAMEFWPGADEMIQRLGL